MPDEQMVADVEAMTTPGGLIDRLVDLLPEPDGSSDRGSLNRQRARSSPPWHGEVASALWDIHAGARELEIDLSYRAGIPIRERGGSHENTKAALLRALVLVDNTDEDVARDAGRLVWRWRRLAESVRDIDTCEQWEPLPHPPKQPPAPCPYCGTLALKMMKADRIVRCFKPGCRDSDGQSPRATMEYANGSGVGVLVFGDGRTIRFGEEARQKESR